jgi:hypothetical protein
VDAVSIAELASEETDNPAVQLDVLGESLPDPHVPVKAWGED